MGGWQALSWFLISPPQTELWVPRSCAFCKGGSDAADIIGLAKSRRLQVLRRSSPALYHVLLYSPQIAAARCEAAGYVPEDSGTGPPALPVRGRCSKRRMGEISFRVRVA